MSFETKTCPDVSGASDTKDAQILTSQSCKTSVDSAAVESTLQPEVAKQEGSLSIAVNEGVVAAGLDKGASDLVESAKNSNTEEQEEVEKPSSRSDLMEALLNLKFRGSTCTAGPAKVLPVLPGLHVKGVGHVPLPICDLQAEALARVAQQAPHGQGMQMVVDKSVRKTWEIEPSQIRIEHAAWPSALEELSAISADALGVESNMVKAEFYKMILYGPGGFSERHRDKEKADSMFARLVVQLPSRYTGGAFIVTHGGESKKFELGSGGDAACGCHFVAHYADCEHEIHKVESGFRLVLVYSLCYTGGKSKPTATDIMADRNKLKSILTRLPREDRLFLLPLDQQYTPASLDLFGFKALKGGDRDRQHAIATASKESYRMMIVRASRTDAERGDGDDECYDFYPKDCKPGSPVLDGKVYGSDRSADLRWIRNQVNFDSADDNGMLLATEGAIGEMWGEGESSSVKYNEYEGAFREKTYETYLLLAYCESSELELMLSGDLLRAIETVAKQENKLQTKGLLAHLSRSKQSVSTKPAEKVVPFLTSSNPTPTTKQIENLRLIFAAWTPTSSKISNPIPQALKWFAKAKDSAETLSILKEFFGKETSSIDTFLFKADMAAYLSTMSPGDDFDRFLPICVAHYRPIKSYPFYRDNESQVASRCDAIASLIEKYGWSVVKGAACACVTGVTENDMKTSAAGFLQTARFLDCLREKTSGDSQVQTLCRAACEALVGEIMKPAFRENNRFVSKCSVVLTSDNKDDLIVRLLLIHGLPGDFNSLERWALEAPCDVLPPFERFLSQMATHTLDHPNREHARLLLEKLWLANVERRLVSEINTSAVDFIHSVRLLDYLHEKFSRDNQVQTLCRTACEALVGEIMKPAFRENKRFVPKCSVLLTLRNEDDFSDILKWNNEDDCSDLLTSDSKDDLTVTLLLIHGLPGDFISLEQWALEAPCDVLPPFERFLSQMTTHTLDHPNREHARLLLEKLWLARIERQLVSLRSNEIKTSAADFIETIRLLDRLQKRSLRDNQVQTLCRTACEAVVGEIMKPAFLESNRFVPKCSVLLTSGNQDVLIRLLLNHGLPSDFDSLEQWALAAPCDVIPSLENFLSQRITQTLGHTNTNRVRLLLETLRRFHCGCQDRGKRSQTRSLLRISEDA
jgi:hypothetical protein